MGSPEKYEEKLKQIFPNIPKIWVRKKADSLFPIVSAASICAKVTRDEAVRDWEFDEANLQVSSREFGSGYPGDPQTKQWLRDNLDSVFGFPSFIRFSWSTSKVLLEKEAVGVEWPGDDEEIEDDDEDNENRANAGQKRRQMTLQDFGVGKKTKTKINGWFANAGCRLATEL